MKSFSAIILSLMMTVALTVTSAWAQDSGWKDPEEIPKGSAQSAYVSEEVDIAVGTDPTMSTYAYIYIPPDPVSNDSPNMGNMGIRLEVLLSAALLTGTAYLIVSKYAYEDA